MWLIDEMNNKQAARENITLWKNYVIWVFILEKIEKEKNIQFLNLIINELSSGIIVIDQNLKIIYKNKYLDKVITNKKILSKEDNSAISLLIAFSEFE